VVLTAPWHERDTRSLVERLAPPVFAPPPDSAEDLMQKFGITAEQAGDGSPDLVWLRAGVTREQVVEGADRPCCAGARALLTASAGGRLLAAYPKRRMSPPTIHRWWYRHAQAAGLVGASMTTSVSLSRQGGRPAGAGLPCGIWSRRVLWAADEAEAVFVDVPRGEKVQSVDHVVVAAHNGSIDPRPLNYVELEGSFQESPALSVGDENEVAPCELHRK
jgi:hypothetical protein